jgi:hypothetical protein
MAHPLRHLPEVPAKSGSTGLYKRQSEQNQTRPDLVEATGRRTRVRAARDSDAFYRERLCSPDGADPINDSVGSADPVNGSGALIRRTAPVGACVVTVVDAWVEPSGGIERGAPSQEHHSRATISL